MKRFVTLAITAVMILGMAPVNAFAAVPFKDVPANEWYYGHVQNAYEKGLIKGKGVDSFGPNDNLTHAEAVTLAANMNRAYTGDTIEKTSGAMWYMGSVNYCYSHGIISQDYDWNKPATRAVYMDIFSRALPSGMMQEINRVDMGMIPDVPAANAYAQSIYSLYRAGIVRGVDDAYSCNPNSYVKRCEVAAILTRMMDATQRLTFTLADPNYSGEGTMATPDFAVISTPRGDLFLGGELKDKVSVKNVSTDYGKAVAIYAKTAKGEAKVFTIHMATDEPGKHNLGFIMGENGKAYEIGIGMEKIAESNWSEADLNLIYEVMEEVNDVITQITEMPGYVEDVEDERIIEFPDNGTAKKEESKKVTTTDKKKEDKKEDKEDKEENTKWDMDDENIIIKTPIGKLYYPEMWQETLDVTVKESKGCYTVRYFETNGKYKVELFAISIGENADGDLLGYYGDDGEKVGVYLNIAEIDEDDLTGLNPEKVYVMQEDVNYLLEKLFELRGFEGA